MAGYGRFILFIDSGNLLCRRNCLLSFYQNASRNAHKYIHEAAFPPKPKRPQTAFLLYLNRIRSKIIKENPDIKASEIVKKASQEWVELDPIEKEDLRKLYNKNYETYVQKLQEYKDSLTDEQKQLLEQQEKNHKQDITKLNSVRKKETFGKPKKPLSAFLTYLLSRRNEKNPEVPYKDWLQLLSTNWKEMSDAEKKPYIIQATELMTQYRKNLKEWELKMMDSGHSDIVRRQTLTRHKHNEKK